MPSETFEIKEYQGKLLSTPIKYDASWSEFDGPDAAKAAGVWPNEADVLKMLNRQAKTAAKANAYNKAIADEKERYEGTFEFKLAKGIKDLLAMKSDMPLEQAEKLARSLLSGE